MPPIAADPSELRAWCLTQGQFLQPADRLICDEVLCDPQSPTRSIDCPWLWGPIFSPPDVTPPFGTIYTPPTAPEEPMPGGFLPGIIGGSARDRLLAGVVDLGNRALNRFLPQTPTVTVGPPGVQVTVPLPGQLPMLGQFDPTAITSGGCGPRRSSATRWLQSSTPRCVIQGKNRKIRGKWVIGADGKLVCCPAPKRMNYMNGRAAMRAARRLKGVFKFQRKVEKALQRACRGSGVRRARCSKKCK
jgi:hypothetical protein